VNQRRVFVASMFHKGYCCSCIISRSHFIIFGAIPTASRLEMFPVSQIIFERTLTFNLSTQGMTGSMMVRRVVHVGQGVSLECCVTRLFDLSLALIRFGLFYCLYFLILSICIKIRSLLTASSLRPGTGRSAGQDLSHTQISNPWLRTLNSVVCRLLLVRP